MRTVTLTTVVFALAGILAAKPLKSIPDEDFPIVRGAGYEGAIVPASSPWHAFHRHGLRSGTTSSAAWTPSPADIATLESVLAALLGPEVLDRSSGLAVEIPEGVMGLSWLRQNVQTLKRQYFGYQRRTARHVLVRVFLAVPESPVGKTWRSEVIMSTDGGCGNAWFDFEVSGQRIVWLKCGGTA
jgi:hypothetical protein